MKRGLNKKGSHVGVILSFVIFMVFVFFLFTILNPLDVSTRDKQAILDYLKTSLVEKAEQNLTTLSFTTNKSTGQECFEITGLNYNGNSIVKLDSDLVTSSLVLGTLTVQSEREDNKLFRVFISPVFQKGNPNCKNKKELNEGEISLGQTRNNKYVFNGTLVELTKKPYTELKEELNIPQGTEFIFSFTIGDSYQGGYPDEPPQTNIISENIPITYFDEKANINSGFINIRIW